MKENLNNQNKEETEGTYEQFDTDETFPQDKKNKNLFSPKKFIKYTLITFSVLCLILLIYNLTQDKNAPNNLELRSNPKRLKLPLEKDELGIKPELKLVENKISLDYSIKGSDITNGKEQITISHTLNQSVYF